MDNNKSTQKPWWRDGVVIFIRVSTYIVIPIIIASLVGNFLDKKYNTGSLLFYILIAIAFLFTIYLIWREMKIYKKKIEREEKDKKII